MDHLPLPQNAGPAIAVPYLDVIRYDLIEHHSPGDRLYHFKQFPGRHGLGCGEDLYPNLDSDELARAIQSWLYFGLISAFFNTHIETKDFTAPKVQSESPRTSGKAWVTSTSLDTLLLRLYQEHQEGCNKDDLYAEEQEEINDNRKEELRKQRMALKRSRIGRWNFRKSLCYYAYEHIRQLDKSVVAQSTELAAVCLSVHLLAVTLLGGDPGQKPTFVEYDTDDESESVYGFSTSKSLTLAAWVWWRLRWCMYTIGEKLMSFESEFILRFNHLLGFHFTQPPTPIIEYPSDILAVSHWEVDLFRATMVRNGWCPSESEEILANQDLLTVYYLAHLRRFQAFSLPHDHCTKNGCVAMNSPSRPHYLRSHTSDACQCWDISVDTDAVCRIIEDGGIPLVYLKPIDHGTFSLELTKMDFLSNYVAVSHVWSDGLGNANGNSLFQCQLEYLNNSFLQSPFDQFTRSRSMRRAFRLIPESLLSKLMRPGKPKPIKQLFWMDTLCIPVAKATDSPSRVSRINELKRKAIHRMNMVYYGATHMLILDGELKAMNLSDLSKCEVTARIVYSRWNTRCWTLQEGALASAWLFRFSDGILGAPRVNPFLRRLRDLADDDTEGRDFLPRYLDGRDDVVADSDAPKSMPSTAAAVEAHIINRLVRVLEASMDLSCDSDGVVGRYERGWEEEGAAYLFCGIWNLLSRRKTSEKTDIPMIFANLLNFNIYQLIEEFPGERMLMGILWNLHAVPLEFLFNPGPRLDSQRNHNNRWVPTELQAISFKGDFMEWGNAGLHITSKNIHSTSLVLFQWTADSLSNKILLRTSKGSRYVDILKQADDEMDLKVKGRYAIAVDGSWHDNETSMPGALFHVHEYITADQKDEQEQRKEFLRYGARICAAYDCPVIVRNLDKGPTSDATTALSATKLWAPQEA